MREDWIECKIKDVGDITSGGTPSTTISEYWDGEISWISPSDLTGYKEKFISKGKKSITLNGLNKSSARLIPAGSVLFSSRAPIGYVVIAKNELTTNQGFKNVSPSKVVDTDFLYHFLKNSKQVAEKVATGTTFKEISKDAFGKLTFPLPPLPEQRAIVKKLESLLSSLDAGVADLKKAQQQLKIYRQAVLKKAFEGEFKLVRIGDVLNLSKEKHKPDKPESLFYIGLEHIEKHTGRLTEKVGFEEINTVKNKFKKDDILYGKLRPNLNKVYLANESGVCSTDILVFTTSVKIIPKFVMQIMLSKGFVNDMSNNTSGVNLPRVSTKYVENYLIPLPSVGEQNEIVKQIESRLSVCDSIEQNIKESLEKAEALRQSILKKAFEGNLLTAQELAACKQAADYEPASVLLQRIRNEKLKIRKK